MLREYGQRFTFAWKIVDLTLFAALFAVMSLHPFFRRDAAVLDDQAMLDIATLALVGIVVWPVLLSHFGAYESLRRESLGGMLARLAGANGLIALILSTGAFVLGTPVASFFQMAFRRAV